MGSPPQTVQQQTPVYVAQPVYYAPPKSPVLAGFLSFFVPGVGQFYNGHVGAGIGFMVSNVVLNSIWMSTYDEDLAIIAFLGAIAVDIWATAHAVRGARKVNAQRGYALGNGMYLNVQPALLNSRTFASNNNYHYGLGVSLSF